MKQSLGTLTPTQFCDRITWKKQRVNPVAYPNTRLHSAKYAGNFITKYKQDAIGIAYRRAFAVFPHTSPKLAESGRLERGVTIKEVW